jgi:uncharacterized protein
MNQILKKNTIFKALTGSRAYGFPLDNSDQDHIGVFWLPLRDLIRGDYPKTIVNEEGCFWEISQYAKLLEEGDMKAIELLYSPTSCWKSKNPQKFLPFDRIKENVIGKKTLEKWLNTASVFYSKALKLGQLRTYASPLSFMTFHQIKAHGEPYTTPFSKIVDSGCFDKTPLIPSNRSLDLKSLGLISLDKSKGVYGLYRDYSANITTQPSKCVKGLFDIDGQIIEDGILPNISYYSLSYEGIIIYDKQSYKKHTKLRAEIDESKVINGYATKSMVHAFRVLELISGYLKTGSLNIPVWNPKDFLVLRKGEMPRDEVIGMFETLFKSNKNLIENYTGPVLPNVILIQKALEEVRNNVEDSIKYVNYIDHVG